MNKIVSFLFFFSCISSFVYTQQGSVSGWGENVIMYEKSERINLDILTEIENKSIGSVNQVKNPTNSFILINGDELNVNSELLTYQENIITQKNHPEFQQVEPNSKFCDNDNKLNSEKPGDYLTFISSHDEKDISFSKLQPITKNSPEVFPNENFLDEKNEQNKDDTNSSLELDRNEKSSFTESTNKSTVIQLGSTNRCQVDQYGSNNSSYVLQTMEGNCSIITQK